MRYESMKRLPRSPAAGSDAPALAPEALFLQALLDVASRSNRLFEQTLWLFTFVWTLILKLKKENVPLCSLSQRVKTDPFFALTVHFVATLAETEPELYVSIRPDLQVG